MVWGAAESRPDSGPDRLSLSRSSLRVAAPRATGHRDGFRPPTLATVRSVVVAAGTVAVVGSLDARTVRLAHASCPPACMIRPWLPARRQPAIRCAAALRAGYARLGRRAFRHPAPSLVESSLDARTVRLSCLPTHPSAWVTTAPRSCTRSRHPRQPRRSRWPLPAVRSPTCLSLSPPYHRARLSAPRWPAFPVRVVRVGLQLAGSLPVRGGAALPCTPTRAIG